VCEPFGVCCLLDGTCIDTGANGAITEAECLAQGGCFAECVPSCDDDGTGNPVVCDLGACCFGEDCVELPQLCCEQDGGVFKGVGVPCTPNPCVINCRGACERKGSLLIFSKVDVRYDQAGNVVQDTFIQITNDYIENVRVQMYFVNGDDPVFDAGGNLVEPGWNSLDNEIELTKDQTFAWSAATGSGLVSPWSVLDPGSPPGRPADDGTGENMLRGFILAWAVNAENEEIRFNHLAGTGTLLRYNEYGRAWEYTACAFNVPSSVAPHGAALGSPGTLFLDGSEYCAPGDLLVQTFQAVGSNAYSNNMVSVVSDTDVTLHPVDTDLRQNAPDAGPVATKAEYTVWNENENKFSGAFRCVYCWDQTLLSDYGAPNHFTIAALQTNFGKFRIDGIEGEQCDVELPNGQFLTARKAAMIGLRAQMMFFGGGDAVPDTAASGVNMRWAGLEPAIIRYQVLDVPPPEAPAGPAGARNPFEAAEMLFDDILEEIEAMRRDEARRGTVN